MHKGFIKTAAVFGVLSVVLGAFGAHYLRKKLGDHALDTFETGVRYQFYHVFALLFTGMIYKEFPTKKMVWSGRFFIFGIILFSFSLYILAGLQGTNSGFRWIGAITPLGGLAFIIGWTLLFLSCFSPQKPALKQH